MQNPKNGTNELVYKTEKKHRCNKLMFTKGKGKGRYKLVDWD